MATFSRVAMDEAQRLALPPRRAAQEQYRQYVRQLSPEQAGRLELEPDDKPITERARLKAAAKAEGIPIHIQRQGNTIFFWEPDEPEPAPTKGPNAQRSRSKAQAPAKSPNGRRGRPKRQ